MGKESHYDIVIHEDDLLINERLFKGKLLITNVNRGTIKTILFILHNKKLKALDSVTVVTDHYDEAVAYIKSKFKIIKAAGGVVAEGSKVLMIYRLGMWDFPKGKIENMEKVTEGAKREVEEECNINVQVQDKICVTWHTYTKGSESILKKTTWYRMACVDDSNMKPQTEEGIDEVKWMNLKELNVALYNAYQSIQHVYKKFKKLSFQSA